MNRRKILHIDINNCYASIECRINPEIADKPVAVAGNPEERHGIILAKNQIAKAFGIKTGETIWEAQAKCPGLVLVRPHFPLYLEFSRRARAIYESYCDRVEPFGIDECWLDVSGFRGNAADLADEIRLRIKRELGITVSIGVSFNKIIAKLGSDMKKPDAVTVIGEENFREKIWGLPASDLLFVGRSTNRTLLKYGIHTIGDLAKTRPEHLLQWFGKNGITLWRFANGFDSSPVMYAGEVSPLKSVSNSTTCYRDLVSNEDVRLIIFTLAESVATRLREAGLKAFGISIGVRDKELRHFSRQSRRPLPTDDAQQIADAALELFHSSYSFENGDPPIRSFAVSAYDVVPSDAPVQLDIFTPAEKIEKQERLNKSVDEIRRRYGYTSIRRGIVMTDKTFAAFDNRLQNETHPVGFNAAG